MERLTRELSFEEEFELFKEEFQKIMKQEDESCDCSFENNVLRRAMRCIKKQGEELQRYEDAEEQGLLLRLKCKAGDTAWVIDEDFEYPKKKKIYEAKWERVTLVQVSENHSFELRGEVSYQVYDWFYNDGRTMPHSMYVGQHNTKVGEVVFFTKEAAEQALKEGVKND